MLAMIFFLLDISWAVYAKSTLQRAVRLGVRSGITLTSTQMASGACLTDTVKSLVQANSSGLLRGTAGLALIKVNYYQPPAANSTSNIVDVSTQSYGNTPGNIMQVSVQGFQLLPLVPRIYGWGQRADMSPTSISVYAADLIEPSREPPCIGTAP